MWVEELRPFWGSVEASSTALIWATGRRSSALNDAEIRPPHWFGLAPDEVLTVMTADAAGLLLGLDLGGLDLGMDGFADAPPRPADRLRSAPRSYWRACCTSRRLSETRWDQEAWLSAALDRVPARSPGAPIGYLFRS